jgi:hypothetical protein
MPNLRTAGIAELFGRFDDRLLQLAIQPDSWGERTRARLMSDLPRRFARPRMEARRSAPQRSRKLQML